MMEIKRNIFQSSVKMPPRYEPCAVKMPEPNMPDRTLPGYENNDYSAVVHARSPRVGDK
ncbi:MAG: hypothetical protein KGL39_17290 [Patescibacteria group bacterium]|nr:hypothetical protein [Patescibacteria group bacterium]